MCSVFNFKQTFYLRFSTLISNEIHSSSAASFTSRKRALSSQWVNGTESPQLISARSYQLIRPPPCSCFQNWRKSPRTCKREILGDSSALRCSQEHSRRINSPGIAVTFTRGLRRLVLGLWTWMATLFRGQSVWDLCWTVALGRGFLWLLRLSPSVSFCQWCPSLFTIDGM